MTTDPLTHLEPSELGTKQYWESFYENSLSHLSSKRKVAEPDGNDEADDEDDDDVGTSWFAEHNAPEKVLRFLKARTFPLAPRNTRSKTRSTDASQSQPQSQSQPAILDLGTGNGSMLTLLRRKGKFTGPMVGVDYSPKSVELARELQRLNPRPDHSDDDDDDDDDPDDEDGEENQSQEETAGLDIRFEEWDILASDRKKLAAVDWFPHAAGGFDIVLDKGTFDAVSLSDETVDDPAAAATETKGSKTVQRRVCERYPGIARQLVRPDGFLVVTSCNWTESELVRWFTGEESSVDAPQDRLVVWGRVEYPKFRFGGQEGQGVCTVCFQRKGARS